MKWEICGVPAHASFGPWLESVALVMDTWFIWKEFGAIYMVLSITVLVYVIGRHSCGTDEQSGQLQEPHIGGWNKRWNRAGRNGWTLLKQMKEDFDISRVP